METIKITNKTEIAHFPNNWQKCVGTGHMGLALRQEYQEALAIVQDEIGFEYIRGHGLLSDTVGIYRKEFYKTPDDYTGRGPELNFTYVDRIYDSFLEKGIRPFVELGFMPRDLASGNQTCFYWKANVTPPKDYGEWRRLIKGLVRHFIHRYGENEVRKWPFEVWNEPDCCPNGFWSADQQEYFRLYRETALAVKEVDAQIQVGGPATCPGGIHWITPFLEMCDKDKIPVDFVSTHSYYGSDSHFAGEYTYQNLHPITHGLDQFKEARRRVRESSFSDLPLHITEYNTAYSPHSPIYDTAFNASFLARLLSEGGDIADSFSYWTFSDVFEENDIPKAQFHGGFGLLALNCIRKPTFHLFSFFAQLGNQLLYRNENVLVTRREDGSLAIVAWNPVLERENSGNMRISLNIPMEEHQVTIRRQTVDENNGNAWTCWKMLGRPRYPDKNELAVLDHASIPKLDISRAPITNGEIKIDFSLSENEVTLIEIYALKDETSDYAGLDDSMIPGSPHS